MKVELRYFDGCPHWESADERLREALSRLAESAAEVSYTKVTSPEEADRLRFRGSPTILVDGSDPFADDAAPVGLSCRLYQTEAGIEGAPSVPQLVQALQGAGGDFASH